MTFLIGTLVVTAAVVAVGWHGGRSPGMLLLMAAATLVVGQVMYLVLLVGLAWLSARRSADALRENAQADAPPADDRA
ncbi:MAG: hypothetical protein IIX61_07560, partial [Loktanella sp.]|nr:hypothetical protein [Loktanella sp.]